MKTYLFPHRLLTDQNVYIAALNCDPQKAHAAFHHWVGTLDPDTITYAQHKLVGYIADRFSNALTTSPLRGVFQNIQRHTRLRSHAYVFAMTDLLGMPQLDTFDIVAVGGTRAMLHAEPDLNCTFDGVEWAVSKERFFDFLVALKAAGLTHTGTVRHAIGREAISTTFEGKTKTQFRILGLDTLPSTIQISRAFPKLFEFDEQAHNTYVGSKKASLTLRRDQFVFDLYQTRSKNISSHLSAYPRRVRALAIKVLGDMPTSAN